MFVLLATVPVNTLFIIISLHTVFGGGTLCLILVFFVALLSIFCFCGCVWRDIFFIHSINQELCHLNYAFVFALSGLATAEYMLAGWCARCSPGMRTKNEKRYEISIIKPYVTASNSLRCSVMQLSASFYVSKESLANCFIPAFLHPRVNIERISSRQITNISYFSLVVTN